MVKKINKNLKYKAKLIELKADGLIYNHNSGFKNITLSKCWLSRRTYKKSEIFNYQVWCNWHEKLHTSPNVYILKYI